MRWGTGPRVEAPRVEAPRVGEVYRLRFPGIAARVIEPPARAEPSGYPFLVESLILRSRWWVNELGEPDNIHSPHMIIPEKIPESRADDPSGIWRKVVSQR